MDSSKLKNFLKAVYPYLHFPKLSFRLRFRGLLVLIISISLSAISFYFYVLKDLPSPRNLTAQSLPQTTHIRDRNGIELFKIYQNQNRTPVLLSELPDYVPKSFISIEDKKFYSHQGFSPKDLLRAVASNINCLLKNNNCTIQGGSTITQQLVKTSLLSPERTFKRKFRELILSVAIESLYSKDQILEMYINRVGFGGASYGIEAAAQSYFGKSAKNLSLGESALLAGLPASPTTYSPFGLHPEKALERQREVLRRMAEDGLITWDRAEKVSQEKIKLQSPNISIEAPHFVMYIKDLLAQTYGHELVELGGLDVTTSLDLNIQKEVEKIVRDETAKIKYLNINNGAALVTHPDTGEILAMVGSRDYFDTNNDGNVNVTLASRQPGSSIKPINYALSLSKGFTAASIIEDAPITYKFAGTEPYTPVNYDRRYHGRVTLRQALANSYNIPAVKVLASNGVQNMIDFGKKLGISTWDDPGRFGLSLTLGGGEVKMIDMAVAYGVFANSGYKSDLHPILKVTDSHGRTLEEFSPQKEFILNPQIAFIITDILSDNNARATTFGINSKLYIPPHKIAVKTGTTNNLRDNWTIGYTPKYLAVVWVGNNDNTPMSYVASGVTGASPIWNQIMKYLLSDSQPVTFTPPEGMKKIQLCGKTGQLACDSCNGSWEYFVDGTAPKTACTSESLAAPTPSYSPILQGITTENFILNSRPSSKPQKPKISPKLRYN